jgi:site-specific recombinase XerD
MEEQATQPTGKSLVTVGASEEEVSFVQSAREALEVLGLHPVSLPLWKQPARRYLKSSLGSTSRRAMTGALHNLVLMLFMQFPTNPRERKRNTHPSEQEQEDRRQLVYVFPWEGLRIQHTSALRAKLLELVDHDDYKPSTANQHLAALRGVLRAAWEMELMTTDEYQRAINIKDISGDSEPAGRSLHEGEIERILAACVSDPTVKGCRDLAILQLLYITGLRRAEVAVLDRDDYTIATQEMKIRKSKRRKGRTVYVKAVGAREALEAWLGFRGDSEGPLFLHVRRGGHIVWGSVLPPTRSPDEALDQDEAKPRKSKRTKATAQQGRGDEQEEAESDGHLADQSIYKVVVERAAEAGIHDLSTHDFRHNHIGDLLAKGIDLSIAQELAGHADPKTTKNYDRRPAEVRADAAEKLDAPVIRWQPGAHRRKTRKQATKPD